MDKDSLLSQRHMKFRVLGGFVEGEPVEEEKKLNMKKKEADTYLVTADIEMEIENLKQAAQEAKGMSPVSVISSETIEKLRQEVDKEMTNAFISMGLQEKLETLKMELSKSPNAPDETLSPDLQERVEELVQEFKHNLHRPGSFMGLRQKLEMLSEVNRLQEHKEKEEKLKKEINEKLREQLKVKMEVLRKAREMVAKGEQLDEDQIEEVEKAKDELKEMLKSVNLEVVGLVKKEVPTAPPGLEVELTKADEVVRKEIENAVDKAGLRWKIEELKVEIESGSNEEKVENLGREIREEIAAVIDLTDLRKKVEATLELPLQETVGAVSSSH